jgi:hypothetical protein
MRYWDASRIGGWSILVLAGAAGCAGDVPPSGPATTGTLEIITATAGVEMDPDGYTLQLDASDAEAIGTVAIVQHTNVPPGTHTMQLGGLAFNCAVAGDNPRSVTITAGETTRLTFNVTCSSVLRVSTSTTGSSIDPAGYSVLIDGTGRGSIGPSSAILLSELPEGRHEVGLNEIDANCQVDGPNPQTVTITPDASTTAAFLVNCTPAPASAGLLRISTATGGGGDPNGYQVGVDGGPTQPIEVNAVLILINVAPGDHMVQLSGLAPNCAMQSPNLRSVTLAGAGIGEVSFAISCTASTGGLEIRTATTGELPDPDGYIVTVEGAIPQRVGNSATLPLMAITAGAHQVALSDLAPNCAVQGDNPRQVTVTAGVTVAVEFTISCSRTPWMLMASGTTTPLGKVSGSSAANVFAAGDSLECPTISECNRVITILHYNGVKWSAQWRDTSEVRDLWAAPNGEAFALVKDDGQFPEPVLHYDGLAWSTASVQPVTSGREKTEISALWGTSATDVFGVGIIKSFGDFPGFEVRPYIVHYDGAQWPRIEVADQKNVRLTGVWGSSSTDVYAVGNDPYYAADPPEGRAVILHYDGHAWSQVLSAPGVHLEQIWGTSANDVYATGRSGTSKYVGTVWHYNGQSWSPLSLPPLLPLRSIWGSSSSDIYVLSGGGYQDQSDSIWHFDGMQWKEIHTGGSALFDIWGSSATDIYAVGAGGTILLGP